MRILICAVLPALLMDEKQTRKRPTKNGRDNNVAFKKLKAVRRQPGVSDTASRYGETEITQFIRCVPKTQSWYLPFRKAPTGSGSSVPCGAGLCMAMKSQAPRPSTGQFVADHPGPFTIPSRASTPSLVCSFFGRPRAGTPSRAAAH